MQTINFIIPYFGEFPNYFQLYLDSVKMNPEFHWTIITDNEKMYDYPNNVKIIHTSFEENKKYIQSKFDFPIELNTPHELCDMKPMYGYIYEDINKGYDFWGYCDLDVVLGRLRKFITDDVLKYDKVFTQGHMTIMRNNKRMNTLFMQEINGEDFYKRVLSVSTNFNFDEDFNGNININTICRSKNIEIYEDEPIADIYTRSSDFRRVLTNRVEKRTKNYYVWNKGKLIRRIKNDFEWISEEYMYIHLQKRKMLLKVGDRNMPIKIIPNEFVNLEIAMDQVGQLDDKVKTKNINTQYFRIRSRNLIVKIRKIIK